MISIYFLISLLMALLACLGVFYLVFKYRLDAIKQLEHRQKIAKMVIDNGWYNSETSSEGFFKDLATKKEKVKDFPKIYYELKEGLIYIKVKIDMGKHQDQLLNLEKKLETGLFCELVEKELKESYIEYTLLYDTISNRIMIDDAIAEGGRLKLMKNLYWEYDSLPHMLLVGGTGGGKSYFILTIIEALLRTNSVLYILDPKNSDLADLAAVMPNVYYKKDEMIDCINEFYENMMKRSVEMKEHPNYRTGQNYAYLNLPANFLIFDEYVAFMDMLGRESSDVISKIKRIVMLGRQAGFFIILACQRPDAKYLGEGIRDQFNFRVALGRNSEMGYGMLFGESKKEFFQKQIKGRGYVDIGASVITEFYTPLVPKEHDFLKEIEKLIIEKEEVKS